MNSLTLPSGHTAFIDEADWQRVTQYRWYAKKVHGTYHAVADIPNAEGVKQRISLHHFILRLPTNTYVYHLNEDGLDNRRQNLSLTKIPALLGNLKNQPKASVERR